MNRTKDPRLSRTSRRGCPGKSRDLMCDPEIAFAIFKSFRPYRWTDRLGCQTSTSPVIRSGIGRHWRLPTKGANPVDENGRELASSHPSRTSAPPGHPRCGAVPDSFPMEPRPRRSCRRPRRRLTPIGRSGEASCSGNMDRMSRHATAVTESLRQPRGCRDILGQRSGGRKLHPVIRAEAAGALRP